VSADGTGPGRGRSGGPRPGSALQLLLYHYREPEVDTAEPVDLHIAGLGSVETRRRQVLLGQGSAYEAWLDMGGPSCVNREMLEQLEAAPKPAEDTVRIGDQPVRVAPGTIAEL